MNTVIQSAAIAAKKVKDDSPDFDPRDQYTIERECNQIARACLASVPESLTHFVRLAAVDASRGALNEEMAVAVLRAVFDAIHLEG